MVCVVACHGIQSSTRMMPAVMSRSAVRSTASCWPLGSGDAAASHWWDTKMTNIPRGAHKAWRRGLKTGTRKAWGKGELRKWQAFLGPDAYHRRNDTRAPTHTAKPLARAKHAARHQEARNNIHLASSENGRNAPG